MWYIRLALEGGAIEGTKPRLSYTYTDLSGRWALKRTNEESIHSLKNKRSSRYSNRKSASNVTGRQRQNKQPQTFKRNACKYRRDCHELGNSPAYGKTYSNSNKIYHFAAVCLSRPKKESVCQLQTGHAEYSDVESNYDDLNDLVLTLELQTNAVTDQQYPRKLFATLVLGEKRVEFLIDSGVTCNIITH